MLALHALFLIPRPRLVWHQRDGSPSFVSDQGLRTPYSYTVLGIRHRNAARPHVRFLDPRTLETPFSWHGSV